MQTIILNFTREKKTGGKKEKITGRVFLLFFFPAVHSVITIKLIGFQNVIKNYSVHISKIFTDKLNKITREFITVT